MRVSKRDLYKLQKDVINLGATASIVHYTISSDGTLVVEASAHRNDFPGGCFLASSDKGPEQVIANLQKQISEVTP